MSLTLGLSLTYMAGVGIYFANKYLSKPQTGSIEVDAEYVDRTPDYTLLFENLGLMKPDKGDWIKCYEVKRCKNYRLVKFKISDTLSCSTFTKAKDQLEEKMLPDYAGDNYKNKLHVFMDKGYMYFRVLNEKIDLIPYQFRHTKKHLIPLGTDLDDNIVYWNIKRDPHMKIVGSTGSGKSRQQNIIINHIYHNIKNAPLWLLDFKGGIEFSDYFDTKNCVAWADSLENAPYVLQSFRKEYTDRLKIIKEAGCRSFDDYIEKHPNSKLQHGFLISDEFSDIMDLDTKEYSAIKELIDLARKVRATGLHIVLGTQRPTADSIPSSMKNNVTGTIGMKTENALNSRLIVDEDGCELLQQSEAIGVLESKKTYFRSFYIEDAVMEATAKQFARPKAEPKDKQPQQQEHPKKKKKKGSAIKQAR